MFHREITRKKRGKKMIEDLRLAAPCGLYCGVCSTLLENSCHGCRCSAEDCFAAEKHKVCSIYCCVEERGLQDCSSCDDFPCTAMIQFAFDPIMRTHQPALENLNRRKRKGIKAWLEEQRTFWEKAPGKFDEWVSFHQKCKRKKRKTLKNSSTK